MSSVSVSVEVSSREIGEKRLLGTAILWGGKGVRRAEFLGGASVRGGKTCVFGDFFVGGLKIEGGEKEEGWSESDGSVGKAGGGDGKGGATSDNRRELGKAGGGSKAEGELSFRVALTSEVTSTPACSSSPLRVQA